MLTLRPPTEDLCPPTAVPAPGAAATLGPHGDGVLEVLAVVSQGGSDCGELEVKAVVPGVRARASGLKGSLWSVRILCSLITHQRMFNATLSPLGCPFVPDLLYGAPAALHTPVPPGTDALFPALNAVQRRAAAQCVHAQGRLQLAQGPPGTGKTTTIVGTVSAFLEGGSARRVLVCAPSNKAVQELCTRFHHDHPTVPVALVAATEDPEDLADALQRVSLHGWLQHRLQQASVCLDQLGMASVGGDGQGLLGILREIEDRAPLFFRAHRGSEWAMVGQRLGTATAADARALWAPLRAICEGLRAGMAKAAALQSAEQEIVRSAKVVFCTLAVSGRTGLNGCLGADLLIIDEAAQCVEPESLVAIAAAQAQSCVLVGDPKQLPATVLSPTAAGLGYTRSLMERLLQCGQPYTQLTTQYRMHPTITQLPNSLFYRGELEDDLSVQQGRRDCGWYRSVPCLGPLAFVNVGTGAESRARNSFENAQEAQLLVMVVQHLLTKCRVQAREIGVLTFYRAQVALLKTLLRSRLGASAPVKVQACPPP